MNQPYRTQSHTQPIIKLSHDVPPSNVYKGWRNVSIINTLAALAQD